MTVGRRTCGLSVSEPVTSESRTPYAVSRRVGIEALVAPALAGYREGILPSQRKPGSP